MESSRIIEHSNEIGHIPERYYNPKLAINRVNQDILYYIFVLAVEGSPTPRRTALKISYVCRHWRKSALEWPVLWRFIDLDIARPLLDLFISRSGNAPLTLSWTHKGPYFDPRIRRTYAIADPNHVSPRLCSLTLRLWPSEFARIRHVLHNPNVPPPQPRHLDIHLLLMERQNSSPLANLMRVDPSCLQKLTLHSVDLPWLELPHNKLTHFKFWFPVNPPAVSHLLKFLSSCPLLFELELGFSCIGQGKIDLDDAVTKSITRLDFPKLKQLTLKSLEVTGYVYIRVLSSRIRTGPALSKFALDYDNRRNALLPLNQPVPDTTTCNIFEAIPPGVLSNFTSHQYFNATVDNDTLSYQVTSGSGYIYHWLPNPPLEVKGSFCKKESNSYDHLEPILDLIRTMPGITCLALCSAAVLLPWIADIPSLFPCLDTLFLANGSCDISSMLTCLPASLKLNRLVLIKAYVFSVDGLLKMVADTGVKVLDLHGIIFNQKAHVEMVETTLRQRGVEVMLFNPFILT